MKILRLPMLTDNYSWLLVDTAKAECAVVDPAEAAPVLARVKQEGLALRWILATHHHWDHTGGNEDLVAAVPELRVICSQYDFDAGRVPGATTPVSDGDTITAAGASLRCMLTPGHTLGAVSYYNAETAALFTGDTLFSGGCGRLFEGTPQQMHTSLERLKELPGETQVYCGHEYTEKNLQFALSLLPDDAAISSRLDAVRAARQRNEATVPSLLVDECASNPYLRSSDPALAQAMGEGAGVDVLAAVRRRRDVY